ncbi:MAG: ABC transporter permease [Elusimicrobiaceae bacterium]|nr:ABC transporter permease [Elusimicrobiaceae bacterium]
MRFESFVAKRYLMSQSKGVFSLITTLIGVLGVAVGVAALITTLAVMTGFQNDIKKHVIGAQAHIMVLGKMPDERYQKVQKQIETIPQVIATAPTIYGQAILSYAQSSHGVLLRGLDAEQEAKTNTLVLSLIEGSFNAKEGTTLPALVLGTELAENMGLDIDDEVVLVSPQGLAGGLPKMKRFKVTGLLKTGYYEFDNTIVYTDLQNASDFLGLKGAVTGLNIKIKNLDKADEVAAQISNTIGYQYTVKTYAQMNQTLYAALKLEKTVMFIILFLIIIVAALNITSNLILFGTEKLRDIGILRTLGASPAKIRHIFLLEGLFIATAGVVLGLILAFILCFIIANTNIVELPADIYYLTKVPVSLQFFDILSVVLGSYLVCFISALYPAYKASKINPVDAVRYG